jgi:hypothetical protein
MNLRKLLSGIALSTVAAGLPALDWQVNSATTLGVANTPSPPTNIEEELFGSLNTPFDAKGSGFELSAHAWAGYPATAAGDFDTLNVHFVYQGLGSEVKKLKWTLGRYQLTEPTGLIVNQPVDGSSLDFDMGAYNLKLAAGYTGLVMRSTTALVLSRTDQESEDLLASPRLLGSLEASAVFSGHTVTFGALAQQDQTDPGKLVKEWSTTIEPNKGGRIDTQYLTLKAEGPLADKLFYTAFATFESGTTLSQIPVSNVDTYEYKPITALLAGLESSWFAPTFLSASVNFRALFASGDGDATSAIEGNTKGNSTMFVPVNSTTLGAVFNPGLSNLGYYELTGSLKPLPGESLVLGGKLMGFHRLVAGAISASGVLQNGPIWMGEELDVFSTWQPYSDLQLTATVGAFLPTAGTYASSTKGSGFQYAVTTGVNLSL